MEHQIKMKTHWNLFSKIIDIDNIKLAHLNARKDKTFYASVKEVDENLDKSAKEIQDMLINKTYNIKESDYSTETINDKWKERELRKLPYYPHRIIQRAIMLQLEPVFMQVFCNHTCASLKDRWIHYAYNLTKKYMKDKENTKYCLKIDIRKFYPSINHEILKKLLRKKIKCKNTLELIDKIIDSYPSEKWVPIWSYLSQYLANYYLAYFDHYLKEELKCRYVVRYMDDIVIFSKDKKRLHETLAKIKEYLDVNLKLQVKPNYQIFPSYKRWVDFVWYRFFDWFILLRKRTCNRMKKRLKAIKEKKTDTNKLLNYHEWCCANSYIWRMIYCNHYRIYEKYVEPIMKSLNRYYFFVIVWKNKKRLKRYYKKVIKKKYFVSK